MLGGNLEKLKANLEVHAIPAAILLSLIAFALLIIFFIYVLGKHSTPMNILLLFLVGISGVFAGYLLFN